jgi:NhaA family Na+:H+ antiporter
LETEAAGGIALLAATVVALAWANSPLEGSYDSLWGTEVGFSLGSLDVSDDFRHWINDALMALFFFVVGLEIKRELVMGELSDRKKAVLPALAALGGMVVPALFYLALNGSGPGARGWGIPMATDIAFAVGVLTLLRNRVPTGLKIFVLTLAVVDDIGAILMIALFYSSGIHMGWLGAAACFMVAIVATRGLRFSWLPVYITLGILVWFATWKSGVHATIAGAGLGLMTPARMSERFEQMLHPYVSYLIVPLFALANAGVVLSATAIREAMSSRVTLGIVLGLVVGKIVGISAMSWVAVRLGIGRFPAGVGAGYVIGASAVAGIGFTVSLFITGLAFDQPSLVDAAKIGVFAASLIAGVLGAVILLAMPSTARTEWDEDR